MLSTLKVHPSPRAGLTLLELIVVISILSLLLALLIPAVQQVRESARIKLCQNHLRQTALAVHQHAEARGNLPAIYNGAPLLNGVPLKQPRHALDEFHFHSWRTPLLPFLDQTPLSQRLDMSAFASARVNQSAINVPVGTFLCPSTSLTIGNVPHVAEFKDGQTSTELVGTAARNDYEITLGVQFPGSPTGPYWQMNGIQFGAWGEPSYEELPAAGLPGAYRFRNLRVARWDGVTDGVSNTILLAERAGGAELHRRDQPVVLPHWPITPVDEYHKDQHQPSWAISTHFPWLMTSSQQKINDTNANGIFSFHSQGANAALCDGSVRFLSESIDQSTLNALITRSSGEPVQVP